MPYEDEPLDSVPIQWSLSAGVGYDDNASPTNTDLPSGSARYRDEEDSGYFTAALQANYVSVQPQTTWDAWARAGGSYYFDPITNTAGGGSEDTFWDLGAGLNVVHRVNERLRLRSRSNVSYQMEPDFSSGIGADRRTGQYTRYSTDNSVGYSWTERFGTVTGYRLHGASYDDFSNGDYVNHLFYNQFRYRLSPATVLTSSLRYSTQSNDTGRDSDSYYVLVGAEHKFSPTTVGVLRVGAQFFEGDDSSTSPYLEATLRRQNSEKFSARYFIRYGIEDRGQGFSYTDDGNNVFLALYDERTTLRIGSQLTYQLSPTVSLFGGTNTVITNYDENSGLGSSDFEERVFNINVGASYRAMENLYFNGSYNFTRSDTDAKSLDYDRNRVNIGVRTTF